MISFYFMLPEWMKMIRIIKMHFSFVLSFSLKASQKVKEVHIYEIEVVEFFNYNKSDRVQEDAYIEFMNIFDSTFGVIGLVINLIFGLVLMRRKHNSSLYIFLLNMSVADLIICSATIWLANGRPLWIFEESFCKLFFTMIDTSWLFVSALLTAIPITLLSNSALTTKRSWIITFVCWMTSLILVGPFQYSICEEKLIDEKESSDFYRILIDCSLSIFLPFIVTVFVYLKILCKNENVENQFLYLMLESAHIICLTPWSVAWHLKTFNIYEVDNLSSFIIYFFVKLFYGFKPILFLFMVDEFFKDIKDTFLCKKSRYEHVVSYHA
jgi:hypothetical protein